MIAKCEANISEPVLQYIISGKHEKNSILTEEEIRILSLRLCMRESFKKIAAMLKRSVSTIQKILVKAAEKLGFYIKEHQEKDDAWIKIQDNPPPEDVSVLVAIFVERIQDYRIEIALRIGDNWFDDKNGLLIDQNLNKISYWKHLPKKPKVKD